MSLISKAQVIYLEDGSAIYTIDTVNVGEINSMNNDFVSKVDAQGVISGVNNTQIAHYSSSNELISAVGDTLGKINQNGSIENNVGEILGYILPSKEIRGADNNLIATAPGVSDRILTYLFFFYPL